MALPSHPQNLPRAPDGPRERGVILLTTLSEAPLLSSSIVNKTSAFTVMEGLYRSPSEPKFDEKG